MSSRPKAAIIVGHGQPSDPDPAEADMADFAARVAADLPGWQILGTTLAKPGALDRALSACPPGAVIYPMFMTHGWFTQVQLVRRLGDRPVRIAPPFGTDPALPALTARHLAHVIADHGWTTTETRLFLAAHGSGRSPDTARDTRAFGAALARHIALAEIRVGFVEEAPYLAEAAAGLGPRAICLPYFAARLGHVIMDIPEALDRADFKGLRLAPIGCLAEIPKLVAEFLRNLQVNPSLIPDEEK